MENAKILKLEQLEVPLDPMYTPVVLNVWLFATTKQNGTMSADIFKCKMALAIQLKLIFLA